jgi:hypothetical protein
MRILGSESLKANPRKRVLRSESSEVSPLVIALVQKNQNLNFFIFFSETSPQNSPTRSWMQNSQLQGLANKVVSYHFCQAENSPTCSVPEFVHSMASQLSQSPIMKPYYQLLVSNHKIRSRLTMEECLANPDDSFIMGIIEPLRSLHGQESIGSVQCVILIDGLCDRYVSTLLRYWLLALLLALCYWHFATGALLLALCNWRFAAGTLLLALCYWRFATGSLLLAICY